MTEQRSVLGCLCLGVMSFAQCMPSMDWSVSLGTVPLQSFAALGTRLGINAAWIGSHTSPVSVAITE